MNEQKRHEQQQPRDPSAMAPDEHAPQRASRGMQDLQLGEGQKQVIQLAQQMGNDWLASMQKESEILSEYIQKLAGVRSFPQLTEAGSELLAKQAELMADQTRRSLSVAECMMGLNRTLMASGARAASDAAQAATRSSPVAH
jgi:hypothetical protein